MPFNLEVLEKAKEVCGFDAYVSKLVAESRRQKTRISVEKLTAQITVRFNNCKMKRLAGEECPPNSLTETLRADKRVSAEGSHDGIEGISRCVTRQYYRMMGEAVGKKVLRDSAIQLRVELLNAVRTIPLSQVTPDKGA